MDGPTTPRIRWSFWLKVVFVLVTVAFGAKFVADRWSDVQAALDRLEWFSVVASALLSLLALAAAMMSWRAVLSDLGSSLPARAASRMFFVSQIGKYLPGSVWPVLAQAQIGRELRVPRRTSVASSLVAVGLSVTVGLSVAALLLPVSAPAALERYWPGLVALPALLVVLHPRILGPMLDRALRLARRPGLPARPSARGTVRAVVWQLANWILLGLSVWVLAVDLGADPLSGFLVCTGGFALAFTLGILFVPAPAGAGVRDAVIVLTLGSVLGTSAALTVALLSRVILAACDFTLAAGASRQGRSDREHTAVDQTNART